MRRRLNEIYREAAEEFARRVVAELGDGVDAVVLYGSVARGEARRESDIDILVVSADPKAVGEEVDSLAFDLEYERGFRFLISPVHLSRREIGELRDLGWPFVREVSNEGVILHDNRTFAGLRPARAAVG